MWDLAKGCGKSCQRRNSRENRWLKCLVFSFSGIHSDLSTLSAFKINTFLEDGESWEAWGFVYLKGVWDKWGSVYFSFVVPQVKLQIAKLAFCVCEPEPWRFHLCDQLTQRSTPSCAFAYWNCARTGCFQLLNLYCVECWLLKMHSTVICIKYVNTRASLCLCPSRVSQCSYVLLCESHSTKAQQLSGLHCFWGLVFVLVWWCVCDKLKLLMHNFYLLSAQAKLVESA